MSTHNIHSGRRISKRYPYYASLPGAIINPHWLELPLSRTNFYGPRGVRAIEVLLYMLIIQAMGLERKLKAYKGLLPNTEITISLLNNAA